MRVSQSEKMEIIRTVEQSELSVRRTLEELGVNRSTFYNWYLRYIEDGYDGLADQPMGRAISLLNSRNTWRSMASGTLEEHRIIP